MTKHANIPIFIPHEGCKNSCVFCNQRTITGTNRSSDRDITFEIESALATIPESYDVEIAFFGGSFTGIGNERMIALLDTAYKYVKNGRVQSIRLSTRPDYISEDILAILKPRGVTHIELGIQSMKQNVLDTCKRGHTVSDTEKACKLINDFGFILGGQMMVGLPDSTPEDEIYTAEKIIEMGAREARIYPCVVFHETELCEMAKNGLYTPISVEEAVERSAKVYCKLKEHNINVLRIGLQSSESLSDKDEVYAGANHPAMGELVMSRVNLDKILSVISRYKENEHCQPDQSKSNELIIECKKNDLSKVLGHKKANVEIIRKAALDAGLTDVKYITNENLEKVPLLVRFGQHSES